jgi:hypothetical protein
MQRPIALTILCVLGCHAPAVQTPSTEAAQAPVEFAPLRIMSDLDPLTQEVRFAHGSKEVLPLSLPVLDRIADALASSDKVERLAISGHVESDEPLELADQRATQVIEWLAKRGIARQRLVVAIPKDTSPHLEARCGTVGPNEVSTAESRMEEQWATSQDRWVRFSILSTP